MDSSPVHNPADRRRSVPRFAAIALFALVCIATGALAVVSSESRGQRQDVAAPMPIARVLDRIPIDGVVSPVEFNAERGFYDRPLRLYLHTRTRHAEIRYTLDGSPPQNGQRYRGLVRIAATTVVRGQAFKDGYVSSPAATHTFVLPATVAQQTPPASYPATWGDDLPADYVMDPEITNDPAYHDLLDDALAAIPTISLAIAPADLFDPETGIYLNTENDGVEWERPASIEFLDPNSNAQFQVDAGLRIQGRSSRYPATTPKHSFRVLFKSEYGPGRLRFPLFGQDAANAFNTLVLRATSNHSWTFPLAEQRQRAQYVRDLWAKDTQRAMGHAAAHSRYAHLYLNGLYWGLYAISERPDAAFMASYFGGDETDYDVRKGGETVDGDDRAWRAMMAIASRGLESDEACAAVLQYLDLDNFIDYLILNHYAGNENWDYGNWYAARSRESGEGFRFFVWDMESILGRVGENKVFVRNLDRPTELFHRLRANAAFRARFEERALLHLTNDGALTPERAAARFLARASEIETAIVAESARWGDYRLEKHPYRTGPFERYTREHWHTEQQRLLEDYFPQRTGIVLEQYRRAGLLSQRR